MHNNNYLKDISLKKMVKEIEIIPDDETIKAFWEFDKKCMEMGLLKKQTYEEYYKEHKKSLKALFG